MDVYGYPSHRYDQSDEMAKQMFAQVAQQSLSNSAPILRNPEPHVMPAPPGTPWNVKGLSWGIPAPPHLVHFTASELESKFTPIMHCKRKTAEVEPVIPAKQLITEEKMAAHLSGLHISTDYTTHSLASNEMMDVNMETSSASVNEKPKGHTIVLSDEIKKLKDEPLLPPALIERLEKPCMSLVVWKQKENIIEKKLKEVEEKEQSPAEEDIPQKRRNGLLVAEQIGVMDVEM